MKKYKTKRLSVSLRRTVQIGSFLLFLGLLFYYLRPGEVDYTRENNDLISPVKLFLQLDPLVGVSTALATKALNWSLVTAGIVLLICMIFPRWFCGYVCPMGTLIDLFDWGVTGRMKRYRVTTRGWWRHLRFYILGVVFIAAMFGVLLSGFVAAIPVLTRGMVYLFAPLQDGLSVGWDSVPGISAGQVVSIILFIGVLGLGFLRPRFWCAYVCPSGALLSLASAFSLTRRTVEDTCIECGRCVRECTFDAIAADYTTRPLACTVCRSCESVCPKQSIKFVFRRLGRRERPSSREIAVQPVYSRRTFLLGVACTAGAGAGAAAGLRYTGSQNAELYPVRPPGSVPEDRFLTQCVRCGECLKACPVNVLQPAGFTYGLSGLWTPVISADIAGCQPSCHNCGQVCPTGAIRNLPLDEKQAVRIGLAEVNTNTCLAHCQREKCGRCFDACAAAGHNAIEYIRVGIDYDEQGMPIADSGFPAPVILEDKCVGCGLCQARCHAVNVKEKKLLDESAVKVAAGAGKEDRIVTGSYKALQSERVKPVKTHQSEGDSNDYLPDFLR